MLIRSKIAIALALAFCLFSNQASGDLVHFSWVDNTGQAGEFLLDTSMGFTPNAISSLAYILEDGTPTPSGFQVNDFNSFAGGVAFDINIGAEGLSFGFASSIDPLPDDPQFYEDQFQSFSFITNFDTRSASSITVTAVPEPSGCLLPILAALCALTRRKKT